jgi:hypothetical protein
MQRRLRAPRRVQHDLVHGEDHGAPQARRAAREARAKLFGLQVRGAGLERARPERARPERVGAARADAERARPARGAAKRAGASGDDTGGDSGGGAGARGGSARADARRGGAPAGAGEQGVRRHVGRCTAGRGGDCDRRARADLGGRASTPRDRSAGLNEGGRPRANFFLQMPGESGPQRVTATHVRPSAQGTCVEPPQSCPSFWGPFMVSALPHPCTVVPPPAAAGVAGASAGAGLGGAAGVAAASAGVGAAGVDGAAAPPSPCVGAGEGGAAGSGVEPQARANRPMAEANASTFMAPGVPASPRRCKLPPGPN